ncbi:hypothetical protein [Nonomuraea sp. NPDC050786]|uniref:hypothetical protein n=1 Tax=Nonomuraea sp. NPDC050786 TaxID=3154840 RepID=UPI0033FE151B
MDTSELVDGKESVTFLNDGQEMKGNVISRYCTYEGENRVTVRLPDGSVWDVHAADLRNL